MPSATWWFRMLRAWACRSTTTLSHGGGWAEAGLRAASGGRRRAQSFREHPGCRDQCLRTDDGERRIEPGDGCQQAGPGPGAEGDPARVLVELFEFAVADPRRHLTGRQLEDDLSDAGPAVLGIRTLESRG